MHYGYGVEYQMVEMIKDRRDKLDAKPARVSQSHRSKPPPGAHGEIGSRLRALFAEAEQEPLPERLIDLLEQLDRVEEANNRPGGKPQETS